MTDSMKFGPEWLRNLSGDSCSSGGGGGGTTNLITPRYQLAEHRYGREEMLALFDRNCKPPEQLSGIQSLFVEKTQLPLALIPMTEDETRLWNGAIATLTGTGRGRGGSVDRGGRIRPGRGLPYSSYYTRGVAYDDSGDGNRIESQSYQARSRPFDRSQSERGWSERNGIPDPGEWNGSTSPRKEMSRGTSGSSLMEGNWRRQRTGGEDEEGWRVASHNRGEKWVRGSWRDGGGSDRARMERADGEGEDIRGGGPTGRCDHRGNHRCFLDSSHRHPIRTSRTWEPNHHDIHDNLPEWATENPSESGGSFDASGAFHGGMYSDDDDDGIVSAGGAQEIRPRCVSEGNGQTNSAKTSNKPLPYSNSVNQGQSVNRHTSTTSSTANRERPKSLHPFEDKDGSVEQERRSVSPTKSSTIQQSNKVPSSPLTGLATRKVQGPVNIAKANETSGGASPMQGPQRSKSFIEQPQSKLPAKTEMGTKDPAILAACQKGPMPPETRNVSTALSEETSRHKTEDDFDRMKEEADMLVAKLMADEESHREEAANVAPPPPTNHVNPMPAGAQQEKWFYRDPQGEVQGPFLANEMAEWCKAGYFTAGLMVRRTCDDRYATLGDLMKMCGGRVPFAPGPPIPPLKMTEQLPPPPVVPSSVPAGMPLPKPGMENPLLLLQYQQMRLLQNQQILLRQLKASAITKLSQSDHWATLSPVEQNQLILQYVMQDSEVRDMPMSAAHTFAPPLAPPPTNPVMQLFNQMQQAKSQADNHLPPNPHQPAPVHPGPVDPIQQLIQQMGGIQNLPTLPQQSMNQQLPVPQSAQDDNPIKSLLRQLNVNANGYPQVCPMESVWPQPPPQINPQFTTQNWLAQVRPVPTIPPGKMPNLSWDLHSKEMKTEQQILEEQNIRVHEDRKKEELRKQEELQRQAEDENAKRKLEEEQAQQAEEAKRKEEEKQRKDEEKRRKDEEKRRKDEEKRRKDEEKRRKDEEKRKQEDELKKKEEKKRKEEEKKREEKRKLDEENNKKKQEEEKKLRDEAAVIKKEMKKREEKLKKDEKPKKLEEEQKVQEAVSRLTADEDRQKAEAEMIRRLAQRRREAEALRTLQERSKAPWAQASQAPPPASNTSLADIQRLEREKKAEMQRFQQMMNQQMEQRKAAEAAQEASALDSSKRLQFKWAEKATPTTEQPQVKSLAQIQQEEQERIVKVKQQEKERQEKVSQKETAIAMQNAGIWGTASQSLNWASSANSGSAAWAGSAGAGGFWDEPALSKPAVVTKQSAKPAVVTPKVPAANPVQAQQQQQQNNNKANKSKTKKDEELVKKLFENNTAKTDDFTQWCSRTLSGLQASVDIPTFVAFLRDIESAYEVKEYVRMYLGDSKQCAEFAKQFLEKRSKWRSAQRPQAEADDLCKPAPAVNPNAPTEFQEVKGKSKKPKKGKMFKVDSRILGFSVTAATDRINVGDRDYGEGV